jgi:hypothetical protein
VPSPPPPPSRVSRVVPVCSIDGCSEGDAACEAAIYSRVRRRASQQASYIEFSDRSLMRFGTNHYALRVTHPRGREQSFRLDWPSLGCDWNQPNPSPGDESRRRLCPIDMNRWVSVANDAGPHALALDQQYRTVCLGTP